MGAYQDLTPGLTEGLHIGAVIGSRIAQNRLEQQRLDRLFQQTQFANQIQQREQNLKEAEYAQKAAVMADQIRQENQFQQLINQNLASGELFRSMTPDEQAQAHASQLRELLPQAPAHLLPGILEKMQVSDAALAEKAKQEQANAGFSTTFGQEMAKPTDQRDLLGAIGRATQAFPTSTQATKMDLDALARVQQAPELRNIAKDVGLNRAKLGQAMSLQNQTGIQTVDPETGEIDPAGVEKALTEKRRLNEKRMTPASIKTADTVISDMETDLGKTLTDQEKARTRNILVTSGNKPPTLDPDTRSKLNVAEYGVDAIGQLQDEIKKHPEVQFGPGQFRYDVAAGKWLGSDPEAAKIAQLYTQLYAGKAFAQGGKNLTANEIKLIRDQIGDPTDATFKTNLATAQQNLVQDLGLVTRTLQDQKADIFPQYKDRLNRLTDQYNRAIKKYGLTPSAEFAAPLPRSGGASNLPAGGAAQAPVRVSSKDQYDALPSGSLYIDDSGQTKRKK